MIIQEQESASLEALDDPYPEPDHELDDLYPTARHRRITRAIMHNRFLNIVVSLSFFIGLWQLASGTGMVNGKLIPPPSVVFPRMITLFQNGEHVGDILASLQRAIIGLSIGLTLGLIIGMLVGRITFFDLLV